MKDEYDFTGGVRGKFLLPANAEQTTRVVADEQEMIDELAGELEMWFSGTGSLFRDCAADLVKRGWRIVRSE